MRARVRAAVKAESGFTLIELIVVMVIIGILASIAIPVFQNQQRQAKDTATKSDVMALARGVSSWYVEKGSTAPVLALNNNKIEIKDGTTTFETINLSTDTKQPAANASKFTNQYDWCVALTNDGGRTKTYNYKPGAGLGNGGSCA